MATDPICFVTLIAVTISIAACSDNRANTTPNTPQPRVATSPLAHISVKNIKIGNWGPRKTVVGNPFNTQPNGDSALWFEQQGISDGGSIEIYLGDTRLPSLAIIPNALGTVVVPNNLINKIGQYPLYIKLLFNGEKVDIGTFEVTGQ